MGRIWINLRLGLTVSKKDLLIILLLCVVFLAIALPNLGYTQQFTTNAEFKTEEGFYLDLGSVVDVKFLVIVLTEGTYTFNMNVSTGSPGNWGNEINVMGALEIMPNAQEIGVNQQTQFLRVDFGDTQQTSAQLSEVAVISQNDEMVAIKSISNTENGSSHVQNLIDEQNIIHYPLNYMSTSLYDEPFYIGTAEQYLHLQMPSEWTHPPLGKLIQASGIAIFGYDPFGWRAMGVVFAALMIPLIYFLGKELLGSWVGGFSAAFLLTFDFMHFSMARIATVDTYLVFFSLASQLFFFIYLKGVLKNGWKTSVLPLFLATLFFALSFSTKWIAIFGFAAEIVILAALRFKDVLKLHGQEFKLKASAFFAKPFFIFVGFLLFAIVVYFATYIPDILAGRSMLDVFNLQFNMMNFHESVTYPIGQTSVWFSWPLMISTSSVPLALEPPVTLLHNNVSIIILLGNPAVWWVGFGAVILLLGFCIFKFLKNRIGKEKDFVFPALFILTFFFFQWVSFVFITRDTFIYHFYLDVPFIALASAFFINRYWKHKLGKILTVFYFASVVGLFVLFYPMISGVPTPTTTIDSLRELATKIFMP